MRVNTPMIMPDRKRETVTDIVDFGYTPEQPIKFKVSGQVYETLPRIPAQVAMDLYSKTRGRRNRSNLAAGQLVLRPSADRGFEGTDARGAQVARPEDPHRTRSARRRDQVAGGADRQPPYDATWRLIGICVAQWTLIDGRLGQHGVDPRDLTLARLLNITYSIIDRRT